MEYHEKKSMVYDAFLGMVDQMIEAAQKDNREECLAAQAQAAQLATIWEAM